MAKLIAASMLWVFVGVKYVIILVEYQIGGNHGVG